jgi:hypothetical protein
MRIRSAGEFVSEFSVEASDSFGYRDLGTATGEIDSRRGNVSRLGAKPWHAGLDTKPGLGDRAWTWRPGMKPGHEARTRRPLGASDLKYIKGR